MQRQGFIQTTHENVSRYAHLYTAHCMAWRLTYMTFSRDSPPPAYSRSYPEMDWTFQPIPVYNIAPSGPFETARSHDRYTIDGHLITTLVVRGFDAGERLPIYEVTHEPVRKISSGSYIQIEDEQGAPLEPPTQIQGIYAFYSDQTGFWAADEGMAADSIFAVIINDEWFERTPRERMIQWLTRGLSLDLRALPSP
ncbi:hypothetical protein BDW22DRAFT_1345717 [Trametopsis cervina]|nr:hypothetical protein BDW22DRAFT_1345717 [Trametopsis cervina]